MIYRVLLLVVLVSATGPSPSAAQEDTREQEDMRAHEDAWSRVAALESEGLPRSAAAVVDSIYGLARNSGDMPQLIRALLHRIRYTAALEEQAADSLVADVQEAMGQAPAPARALLHSILAELYTRYYRQHRRQIQNRTAVQTVREDDLRTWDSRTFIRQAMRHYLASVAPSDTLQSISVDEYETVLIEAPESRHLRPTLYDFLVHRAIDFFERGEAGLLAPERALILEGPEVFAPARAFIRLEPADDGTPDARALKLLQDLLAFHTEREETAAYLEADLRRLQFVYRHSVVPAKDSLYLAGLEHLRRRHAGHPAVSSATLAMARWHELQARHEWQNVRGARQTAFDLCEEAIARFPESHGAEGCRALKSALLQAHLWLDVEAVIMSERPALARVSYRNVDRAHVKIVPVSFEEWQEFEQGPYDERPRLRRAFNRRRAAAVLRLDLPGSGDMEVHSADIRVPALEEGSYVMIVAPDSSFSPEEAGYAFVQSSHLSYTLRPRGEHQDVYVLDRETGAPIEGAEVALRYDQRRNGQTQRSDTYLTNADGLARVQPNLNESARLSITYRGSRLEGTDHLYGHRRHRSEPAGRLTTFFTDRAIYRPGQTIYFKGILLAHNGDRFEIEPSTRTRVRFLDANQQEVAALELTTNEFGTFSGTFVAPQGGLAGQMRLENGSGQALFSVEEYKRPRFEVALEQPGGTFVVGDTVRVPGVAMAYAGAGLDGAEVVYRVMRTSRLISHRSRRSGIVPTGAVEISRGMVRTDRDGRFEIRFPALPDRRLSQQPNTVFEYEIHADVTDITGETHGDGTSVRVGYMAHQLYLNVHARLDKSDAHTAELDTDVDTALRDTSLSDVARADTVAPRTLTITSANLNGAPVSVDGQLAIYRLDPPDRYLLPRRRPEPDQFILDAESFREAFPHEEYRDESDPATWAVVDTVLVTEFAADTSGTAVVPLPDLKAWPSGAYRFVATSTDAGHHVESVRHVEVFSSSERNLPYPVVDWFVPLNASGEPGEVAAFLVGSAAEDVHVRFDVEHDGEITRQEWLEISNEQRRVEVPIRSHHRGGFAVHVMFVRDGRAFEHTAMVGVPHSDKELEVTLATFRDRVKPGSSETWKIRIGGPQGDVVASEMVAAMYDASLDALRPHNWSFDILPSYVPHLRWNTASLHRRASAHVRVARPYETYQPRSYDQLNWFGFHSFGGRRYLGFGNLQEVVVTSQQTATIMGRAEPDLYAQPDMDAAAAPPPERDESMDPLMQVQVRSRLGETAFFYPHLETNEQGDVVLSFTVPEALTRWRLLAFAHTKDLAYGQLAQEIVTQKELMVTPHAPRFFREADSLRFTAKVANLTDSLLAGRARLYLFDALTMEPLDADLGNVDAPRVFRIEGGGSASLGWELTFPEGYSLITYRVVAEAGSFSDGEEAVVPILPNRMLVTETLPLPVSGEGAKTFALDKLVDGTSSSLEHHALTLEFTPNPVWYAVQALPYLMDFPHESADQLFGRFYANSIAAHIIRQNPRIEQVYNTWRAEGSDALVSKLEKNEDLKALLLEATPWLVDGRDETARKQRIALLFERNNVAAELDRTLRRLAVLQLGNGAWPWFEGMQPNRFVTQHIVAGLGHLQQLGVLVPMQDTRVASMLQRALRYLDDEFRKDYERLLERGADLRRRQITPHHIHYLYARSFFSSIEPPEAVERALVYYRGQARRYWLEQNRYLQGMTALALHRHGDGETPRAIVRSLREYALHDEEMGMYWKRGNGFYWHNAPIETQALLIEVFQELTGDELAIEAMKRWLLKQKQAQNWRSTRATAEAVYALLLRGTDLTANDTEVEVQLGDVVVEPSPEEAGTGYFRTNWNAEQIQRQMGRVTVRRKGDGTAWGSLTWQYFETLDRITPHDTPLQLEKQLHLHTITEDGPLLVPVANDVTLTPGDLITVRLVLRTDRNLEYVHLQDMRAAAMEPLNVLSGYRYQDGLGYYESTRDAATHFFFDRMPAGTYVFEYPLRVTHAGSFLGGIATIQSMYAPEFAAHSEGVRVEVKEEREEGA